MSGRRAARRAWPAAVNSDTTDTPGDVRNLADHLSQNVPGQDTSYDRALLSSAGP